MPGYVNKIEREVIVIDPMIADGIASQSGRRNVAPIHRNLSLHRRRDAATDIGNAGRKFLPHSVATQFLEQRRRLYQVGSGEALREIAMRRRHHFISFMAASLPAPEAREARGGAQCKGPALLTVSSLDRLMKAILRHCLIARLGQQQLTA